MKLHGHEEHRVQADPTGHEQHTTHTPAGPGDHAPAGWGMASRATLHCLTGCAIGEVLGTALGWHNVPTLILAIALAFFFGYALTLRGVLRTGLDLKAAVKIALAADTLSIAVMELVDNSVIALIPGAMDAGLSRWLFWGALALSLVVAFVVTTPVNRWMIGRGKGHAVVHGHHG
jgi:hypothetical protein